MWGRINDVGRWGWGTNPAPESGVIFKTTNGPFSVAMSTWFQPAEWDSQLLTLNPSAITMLGSLGPHHIRLQGTRREYRADLGYGLIILRPRPELGNLKMSITTYGK